MFNDNDNYPSIASILSLDKAIDQKDLSAVYAALDAQDVEFASEAERDVVCMTARVAEAALKPCSIKEERPCI